MLCHAVHLCRCGGDVRQSRPDPFRIDELAARQLALPQLRLGQDDRQRLLQVMADHCKEFFLLDHRGGLLTSQRACTLLRGHCALCDVVGDGAEQTLRRRQRCPGESSERFVFAAEEVLETERRFTLSELLECRTSRCLIGRMNEADERLLEQFGFGVPERRREPRRQVLEAAIGTNDGQKNSRQ